MTDLDKINTHICYMAIVYRIISFNGFLFPLIPLMYDYNYLTCNVTYTNPD